MHFIAVVPLGLAILWVIFKGIVIFSFVIIACIIGSIAWAIYAIFFKKDEPKVEERNPEAEYWEEMMEQQRKDDAEFYKRMGRLEQQLEDLEQVAGTKKKRSRKKKNYP
jgi:hypothetical protein